MHKTILFAAALSLAAAPACAHHGGNGTADAILGVAAGAALGVALTQHNNAPPAYAYAPPPPPPPPMRAPNGVYCQMWDGYRYIPAATCR